MPDPAFLLDGKPVSYRVRVSDRARRVSLRFSDAGLEVVRPTRLRGAFAPEALLHKFSAWIRRQLKRHGEAVRRRAAADGRLLLRGRERRLERRDGWLAGVGGVWEEGDALIVEAGGSDADAAAALRTWLFAEARREFAEALARRAAEMAQPFGKLAVRDQRWLWGSCSPRSGTVSLNVRLLLAPPEVLDYIVVHELTHFRWRGHGVRFWERVERFCPDAKRHRRWLRENAWRLRLPDALPAAPPSEHAGQAAAPLL